MANSNINTGVNSLSAVKSFRVVIANDPDYFTSENYNKVINGFTTEEAANNAAFAAVEEIAKDIRKGATVVYSETLNAFVVWSGKRYYGRVILITAKVEEVETTPTTPETETTANTETAMTTTDTTDTAPAHEETHAANCLNIYLMNESEIYNAYTVPAIKLTAAALQSKWMPNVITHGKKTDELINAALQAAARLVRKYDHMTPTAADVAFVSRNYVAYIIECAQYETANA